MIGFSRRIGGLFPTALWGCSSVSYMGLTRRDQIIARFVNFFNSPSFGGVDSAVHRRVVAGGTR